MLVAWALAAERDADPAGALTRLLALFDPDATLEFSRLDVIGTQWLPEVVRLALATGEPAVAAAATKACVREADTQAAPPVTAGAQHCQGLLDRDPAAVRAAAGQLQSFGFPLLSGQALENAAVLYAEKGDAAAARSPYLQAVGIYRGLGADWDIMRADTRLRQHNIRRGRRGVRRRPATGWDALTSPSRRSPALSARGCPIPTSQVECSCPATPSRPTSPISSPSSTHGPGYRSRERSPSGSTASAASAARDRA